MISEEIDKIIKKLEEVLHNLTLIQWTDMEGDISENSSKLIQGEIKVIQAQVDSLKSLKSSIDYPVLLNTNDQYKYLTIFTQWIMDNWVPRKHKTAETIMKDYFKNLYQ